MRLDLAAGAMRAAQHARGPEFETVDESHQWTHAELAAEFGPPPAPLEHPTSLAEDLAADAVAAVQLHTTEPPLTAAEFAAAVAGGVPFDPGPNVPRNDEQPAPSLPPAAPAPTEREARFIAAIERGMPTALAAAAVYPGTGESVPAAFTAADVAAFSSERSRTLDWRPRHDERSLLFGVAGRDAGAVALQDVELPAGPVLDQGPDGACVGFATVAAVNVRLAEALEPPLDAEDAHALYARAQRLDERPGENYTGTSVNGGMLAGREAGLFGGWLWCFGTKHIAQTIMRRRPVVIGVPWLSGMWETGPGGLVEVAGDDEGMGHCLAVVGLKLKGPQGQPGPFFIWQNSHGTGYGAEGFGYVHHRTLAGLLRGIGEAAVPTDTAPDPR